MLLGYNPNSNASIIVFKTLNEPSKPFCVTTLKLSLSVWYSGYSFDLEKLHKGKSTPGAQYCLSSLPRRTKEYLITFGKLINEASKEKLVISESVGSGTAGAGNAPTRAETVGKWANTSNQISEVKITTSSNAFAEGSEVTVYGTDWSRKVS